MNTTMQTTAETINTNNESGENTMTITTNTLNETIANLNILIENNANVTKVNEMLEKAENEIKEVNAKITSQRIDELLTMKTSEMFNDFIDNQFVNGFKLSQNSENNLYSIVKTQKRLPFVLLDKKASEQKINICNGFYLKLTALFMDNLYRTVKSEVTVNDIEATSPTLNTEYENYANNIILLVLQ